MWRIRRDYRVSSEWSGAQGGCPANNGGAQVQCWGRDAKTVKADASLFQFFSVVLFQSSIFCGWLRRRREL
jgi:hypothetical protein